MSSIALLALSICGCVILAGPGEYGNWWKKLPAAEEKPYFERALQGPLSPDEPFASESFVGWFGVIVKLNPAASSTVVSLDHRYADELNVYYGIADSSSIHTVSLFGGGTFETVVDTAISANWLEGDLLRVYGGVRSQESGCPVVSPAFIRHWPRVTYELSPLRPERSFDGELVRRNGWPELVLDQTVASTATPVDAQIQEALLGRFPHDSPQYKVRIAYTLGELGGPDAIAALRTAMLQETDTEHREAFASRIERAERKLGPIWNPGLPYPYWKSGDSPR